MFKRLSLLLAISLHTLMWGGVASKDSLKSSSRAHFSLADLFSPSTYKMSSSSVLQALGKFLPVIYQNRVNSAKLFNISANSSQTLRHALNKSSKSVFQTGMASHTPTNTVYALGQYYAELGGVVIYLTQDSNPHHGLVAALGDVGGEQAGYAWGIPGNTIFADYDYLPSSTPNPPYEQYYAGYKNQIIILQTEGPQAALAAQNYTFNNITGWWLPAISELTLIANYRDAINTAVAVVNLFPSSLPTNMFSENDYWSSTESTDTSADSAIGYVLFPTASILEDYKSSTNRVRCVRAF